MGMYVCMHEGSVYFIRHIIYTCMCACGGVFVWLCISIAKHTRVAMDTSVHVQLNTLPTCVHVHTCLSQGWIKYVPY